MYVRYGKSGGVGGRSGNRICVECGASWWDPNPDGNVDRVSLVYFDGSGWVVSPISLSNSLTSLGRKKQRGFPLRSGHRKKKLALHTTAMEILSGNELWLALNNGD